MRAISLLLLLSGLAASATPGARAEPCADAAREAEAAFGLPDGLLAAIGRVETGRRGADGRLEPWPWSVNAMGRSYILPSGEQAIAVVAALQAEGTRSIDVGCFQINLLAHPDVFTGLADGFDPKRNAAEAARFLSALHARTGDWDQAVADYHSTTPALGESYRRQVYAALSGAPSPIATGLTGPSPVAGVVVIVPRMAAFARPGMGLPVVVVPRGVVRG